MKINYKVYGLITSFFFIPLVSFAQVLTDTGSAPECMVLQNNLSYGKRDSQVHGEVSELQAFLKELGLLKGNTSGSFGVNTRNAVKAFQRQVLANVNEDQIDTTLVPNKEDRKILADFQFRLSASGAVGKYTRAKIAYISCHENSAVSSFNTDNSLTSIQSNRATSTIVVPGGACLYDEAKYKQRGYKMTVSSSDGPAWISTNNMTSIGGKLYLLNKPGTMWSLWDINTNQLTQAMLSCQNGVITESGMPAPKKVLTAAEQVAAQEADITQKCANGTYPSIYAICQPPEKRLQYLKDQFAKAKKPMSLTTVNSFGPGFTNSEQAFADWKYVTVGPFVVSCDELATTYNFYWLKGPGGTIGNWGPTSNRNFYDTNGTFIGSGGAAIHTTQYKDKVTGEAMTEPDISFEAIGYCNHAGVSGNASSSPSLQINRTQINNEQTLSWVSKNITKLSYTCLDSNNVSTGDVSVALNLATTTTSWAELRQNGWKGTYHCSWKADGTTVVATETFTIGN